MDGAKPTKGAPRVHHVHTPRRHRLAGGSEPQRGHRLAAGGLARRAQQRRRRWRQSCKLPGGKTIDSGSTGTDYGSNAKTYECKDGIACQVEGGKTTDKCSHTATIIKVTRGNRVQGTVTVSARL